MFSNIVFVSHINVYDIILLGGAQVQRAGAHSATQRVQDQKDDGNRRGK